MYRNQPARGSGRVVLVKGLGGMWQCPRCGRKFANKSQWHGCGRFTVAQHFKGKPQLRKLYDAFLKMVRENGPVREHPVKTRIAFIARMSFCGVAVMKDKLRAGLILTRRVESPRFFKITKYTSRCFGHYFYIQSMDDLDDELRRLVAEAYRVGMQQPLGGVRTRL